MNPPGPQQSTPFAAEGGLPPPPVRPSDDPLRALFDLMVVVEALSPTWPERPTFAGATRFLL